MIQQANDIDAKASYERQLTELKEYQWFNTNKEKLDQYCIKYNLKASRIRNHELPLDMLENNHGESGETAFINFVSYVFNKHYQNDNQACEGLSLIDQTAQPSIDLDEVPLKNTR
jgi:hypothetical protein